MCQVQIEAIKEDIQEFKHDVREHLKEVRESHRVYADAITILRENVVKLTAIAERQDEKFNAIAEEQKQKKQSLPNWFQVLIAFGSLAAAIFAIVFAAK